jgi:hypothetical protein
MFEYTEEDTADIIRLCNPWNQKINNCGAPCFNAFGVRVCSMENKNKPFGICGSTGYYEQKFHKNKDKVEQETLFTPFKCSDPVCNKKQLDQNVSFYPHSLCHMTNPVQLRAISPELAVFSVVGFINQNTDSTRLNDKAIGMLRRYM